MEKVERQTDFGSVEASMLFGQPPLALHVEHEVSASHELDHEEQPAGCLEAGMQPDEERVVRSCLEHVLLRLHPVYILQVNNHNSRK